MVKLATMETEAESKEAISVFWRVLNAALSDVSGVDGCKFNPSGIMVDEGGGWWSSIPLELPEGTLERTISCEKHWGFTVKRNVTAIQAQYGNDVGEEFTNIADGNY